MLTVNWQGERLSVRRLLLRSDVGPEFDRALLPLAARHGLEVGDESSDPRAGDFWIGCHPVAGWGASDPAQIGWASVVEVPVAVAALREQDRPQHISPFVEPSGKTVADRPLLVQFA